MKRSVRFKKIVELAEQDEKKAVQKLGKAKQHLIQETKRLDDLNMLREEYQKRFISIGSRGVTAGELRQYQAFIKQIDAAVEIQYKRIDHSKLNVMHVTKEWEEVHIRYKALAKVLERNLKLEAQIEAKQEQRISDDRGQRTDDRF